MHNGSLDLPRRSCTATYESKGAGSELGLREVRDGMTASQTQRGVRTAARSLPSPLANDHRTYLYTAREGTDLVASDTQSLSMGRVTTLQREDRRGHGGR